LQTAEAAKSKTKGRVKHQAGFNEEIWSTTGRVLAISAIISLLVVGAAWLIEARFSLD